MLKASRSSVQRSVFGSFGLLICFALSPSALVAANPVASESSAVPARALLCIDRPEQNGRLNIVPTRVWVVGTREEPNGYPEIALFGGQNACFKIASQKAEIKVRFTRSPLGPGDVKTYWILSFPVAIDRRENDYVLDVDPTSRNDSKDWEKTGWHRTWKVQAKGSYCRTEAGAQWGYCDTPDRR